MALDFLAGLFGGGDKEPTITQIAAPPPNLPNLNELNSAATARIHAGMPWTFGPYRALDYVRGVQATPNMIPQFHQMAGMGGMTPQQMMGQMFPVGGNGYMANFQQPHPAMMQPQYSPLAWAMGLGQLFSQLGGLYQQQMLNGGMGQQQTTQAPLTKEQVPTQQNQGGTT